GLEEPLEDSETSFTIFTKDRNGTTISTGGFSFGIDIEKSTGDSSTSTKVVDNNDGTYTVFYTPTQPGEHICQVTLAGVPIKGSPYKVNLQSLSGVPDASNTIAYGRGLKKGVVNKRAFFVIVAKNRDGKRLFNGGAEFD